MIQDGKTSYKGRSLHPISEAEKVIMNKKNLIQAGKDLNLKKVNGEFIGILKLNKNGCKIFRITIIKQSKDLKTKHFLMPRVSKSIYNRLS